MGYSVKEICSFYLLLLLLSDEVMQAEEITRMVGQDIKFNFTSQTQTTKTVKTVSLYKDNRKIGECSHQDTDCIFTRGVLTKNSQRAIVSISNLTLADSGNYSVTFFFSMSPLFSESKLVSLVVHSENIYTDLDSAPQDKMNGNDFHEPSSGSFLYVYIIIALGLISVLLPTVLLSCFYQSPRGCSGHRQKPCISQDFQVPKEAGMLEGPIEYVALEFPKSLGMESRAECSGKALKLQETVEYATISFPKG